MTSKSKKILSEISAGELLDKISILEIKLEKVKDKKCSISKAFYPSTHHLNADKHLKVQCKVK